MNKRPTRSDVAKKAGVSDATVSYVINNGPRPVADETRERVLAAIKELGYRPHTIAQSLKTGRTRTVGLLVPSLLPSLFGHLVTAVEDELAERNYGLILASSHEDYKRERRMLSVLVDRSIDGLLYIPMSDRNDDTIIKFMNDGLAAVFVDRYSPRVSADVVMTDNIGAAKQATKYLLQSGCKHIVCISFSDTASSALDRVLGYRLAHQEMGLQVAEENIILSMWPFGGRFDTALLSHIDRCGMPDGVFCTVEGFLSGTVKTLRSCGIRVPDQVMVAGGFTAVTSPWQELMDRPIPILRQNYQLMAKRAVDFIMERLDGENSLPRVDLIPAEFIV